jgi:hypothetical protein
MCYKWFCGEYPQYDKLLFHPHNEIGYTVNNTVADRRRTAMKINKAKASGMVPGVADLMLLVPNNEFPFMAIELKIAPNKPSKEQEKFRVAVQKVGGKHVYIIADNAIHMKQCFVKIIRKYMPTKSVSDEMRDGYRMSDEAMDEFIGKKTVRG